MSENPAVLAGRTRRAVLGVAVAACLLGGAGRAEAQTNPVVPCPNPLPASVSGNPLVQPRVIRPVKGTVNTSLVVRMADHQCIPAFIDNQWVWKPMTLRTYFAPQDGNNPGDPNLVPSIPGPTFRIKKALLANPDLPPGPSNPEVAPGTRFRLLLRNRLPPSANPNACEPAEVLQPPAPGCEPNCDKSQKIPQVAPDCFHGANVTNIHFHGSHVSPQPHQDYIFLELYPEGAPNKAAAMYPTGASEIGQYQTDINPIPWNQAPGTHWYHAHKHASTAVQVLNGMAGALLMEGSFDDWLYGLYKVDPNNDPQIQQFEKVMVVQQIWPELNFYQRPHPNYPPPPLVNGQAEPVIPIRYGEVQRLRMVGATMQAAAQLTICFDSMIEEGYRIKQMAQDGVQFAPENWQDQPLLVPDSGSNCKVSFNLAPGNRADFLVQAPPPPANVNAVPKKRHSVSFRVFGNVAPELKQILQDQVRKRRANRAAREGKAAPSPETAANAAVDAVAATNPVLFTMELSGVATPAMSLPAAWPEMPYFLRDVAPGDIKKERTIAFSMTDPATGVPTQPGTQPNGFWIDKTKYNPNCANQTMELGTSEKWTVTNDSGPNHPFHIHVNPFQVVRNDTTTYKKPIWQDTIALPTGGCNDVNAGPIYNQQQAEATCPGVCSAQQQTWNGQWKTTQTGVQSVCGCCTTKSVELRSRFEDYTGGYVYHCHFLGHEDRGMMHNVQTVCPAGTGQAGKYGLTVTTGRNDDCGGLNPLQPLPACTPGTAGNGHEGHH